jgi:uncharacterized BrkB/YihY/UPF0761 family membrane protein
MLHPLFSTLIQRPDLLVEHLSAYGALFREETSSAGKSLLRRSVAWVLVGVLAMMFMLLTGIAVMLGVMQNQFQWVLVIVPGAVLMMTLIAYFIAGAPAQQDNFTELKAQINSDLEVFIRVNE